MHVCQFCVLHVSKFMKVLLFKWGEKTVCELLPKEFIHPLCVTEHRFRGVCYACSYSIHFSVKVLELQG